MKKEEVGLVSLKTGKIKSCGCLQRGRMRTHGLCGSKTYHIWAAMIQRCLNENNDRYSSYGGREIKVCKKWLNFENFYKDMGEKPERKSLDRVNNNGDYEPENCRWATWKEQANNKRNNVLLEFKGRTLTVAQWGRKIGLGRSVIYGRLRLGWSIDRTLKANPKLKEV